MCCKKISFMSANLIPRTRSTMIFNDLDFLSPNYTWKSFLSNDNAYFSFILQFSTFCSLFRKATEHFTHEFRKTELINRTCLSRILCGYIWYYGKAQNALFWNLVAEFPTDVNSSAYLIGVPINKHHQTQGRADSRPLIGLKCKLNELAI